MPRRSSLTDLAAWKEDAFRRMTRSRESTLRLVKRLPESEVLRPRTQGMWSVKDVLAHLVAWEEEAILRLDLTARGRGDQVVFYEDMQSAHQFNARAIASARSVSLTPLLRRMERVRKGLTERLRRLPLASLNDPSHRYPVTAWLPEFAWTHERHHRTRIRKWWKENRPK